jgi:hypothetical protein
MLEFENSDNTDHIKRFMIRDFLKNASEYVDKSEEVLNRAREISQKEIKVKDAWCISFFWVDKTLNVFSFEKFELWNSKT